MLLVSACLVTGCGQDLFIVAETLPAITAGTSSVSDASAGVAGAAGAAGMPQGGVGVDSGAPLGTPCGKGCRCEGFEQSTYMFCPDTIINLFAIDECAAEGMTLANVGSEAENAWINQTAARYELGAVWLGGNDDCPDACPERSEGEWLWVDLSPFWTGDASGSAVDQAYVNWAPGQPDNTDNSQDCLAWSGDFGRWDDRSCPSPAYQGCEADNLLMGCDPDCVCADYGGHRYTFCSKYRTWQQNFERCAANGTSMIRVDDAGEDAFLEGQFNLLDGEALWFGGSDTGQEGIWQWPNGDDFFDAVAHAPLGGFYNNFPAGQPDNRNFGEDCMAMLPSGQWEDRHCRMATAYVCEGP